MNDTLEFKIPTLFILLLFAGCRQDFDLTTEYQETTVVYGMLNVQDSVQYIRVQRGYIDTAQDALVLAKDPDSIYYGPSLEVELSDQDSGHRFKLQRINGAELGLPKDSGLFAHEPNILYRLDHPLNGNSSYQLAIHNPKTGKRVTATTSLVQDLSVLVPNDNYIISWTGADDDMVGFSWKHAANAGIYDMEAIFWYTNFYQSGITKSDSVRWKLMTNKLALNEDEGASIDHVFGSAIFYQNIGGRIPQDTAVLVRSADSMTFLLVAGGIELGRFISNQRVRNGLLSGMALPYYTNVNGGYGVFSSILRDTITSDIGPVTQDSLRHGQHTKHLKFY